MSGWIPDLPDWRDLPFIARNLCGARPGRVDLRERAPVRIEPTGGAPDGALAVRKAIGIEILLGGREAMSPWDLSGGGIREALKVAKRCGRIERYARLCPHLDVLKACLQAGHPWVCGLAVDERFGESELVAMPAPASRVTGGIAAVCIGYDCERAPEFVMASGCGLFRVPFAYLDWMRDFWTLRLPSAVVEA